MIYVNPSAGIAIRQPAAPLPNVPASACRVCGAPATHGNECAPCFSAGVDLDKAYERGQS